MRPHPRRARTDPTYPRAWATSDRNGHVGNHADMVWQYDWSGPNLINKRILIHKDELDKPQQQLRTIVIPADPPPIMNARPEPYSIDEANPAETSLTAAAALGTTSLTVDSTSDFSTGDFVVVACDDGQLPRFSITVNSATSITTNGKLPWSASVGNYVTVVQ